MERDFIPHEKVAIQPMECLDEAKAVIGEQYWLFVGITTVGLLIASAVPFSILLGPMICGIFLCFADRLQGKQTSFETLFKGFDYFVDTLIATLILVAGMMVVIAPVYVLMMVAVFTSSHRGDEALLPMLVVIGGGTAVILAASVLFYVLFIFVYPLILFGRLKPMPAIKTSVRASLANLPGILGLVLLLHIIGTIAAMCCYVPAFLVAPILIGSVLMAYRKVFPDGFVPQSVAETKFSPEKSPPGKQGNPFADFDPGTSGK